MKTILNKPLQIIISLLCIVYAFGFIEPLTTGEYNISEFSFTNKEHVSVIALFILYLAGTIVSWVNLKKGALLILIWHVLIWIFSLFIWVDAGMVLILAFPIFIIAVFMLKNAYSKTKNLTREEHWSYFLNILLINYGIIYIVNIIWALFTKDYDYLNMPFIIFPMLFFIFIIGFYFSKRKPFISGVLFILWYVLVVYGSYSSSEFFNEGPHFVFGFPILVQGVLYIIYSKKFKPIY